MRRVQSAIFCFLPQKPRPAYPLPPRRPAVHAATEKASATHAWVEVFVPGHRWQGLDPTHNCVTNETYVKLAVGRDYADVSPVRGTYKGATESTLNVEVKIKKIESE